MAILAIAAPIWDVFEARRLRKSCTSSDRIRYYVIIIALLWTLTAGAVAIDGSALLTAGPSLAPAHAFLTGTSGGGIVIGLTTAVGLLCFSPFLSIPFKPKIKATYTKVARASYFGWLFPTTSAERRWFAALCVSAGICEETICRSYVVHYFNGGAFTLGVLPALIISSVIFGLNHGYQGWGGVVKTAIIGGLLFGTIFFATGSLWIAMIIHALVDLQTLVLLRPDWAVTPLPPAPAEPLTLGDSTGS